MTIEEFKQKTLPEKLNVIRYEAELLGSYERNGEHNGPKTPGGYFCIIGFLGFFK